MSVTQVEGRVSAAARLMRSPSLSLLLLLAASASGFVPIGTRWSGHASTLRTSTPLACDSSDDLEAQLKEAVAREDYKKAADIKKELDAAPVNVERLYASLQARTSELTSRRDATSKERRLVKDLGETWPKYELAQQGLWDHWYGEYGKAASERLKAAEGEADVLTELMDEFPDWVEPANRLATLRFLDGDYAESVELCLKILRRKPWHFGACSGIVMCYARLGDAANADKWKEEIMPPAASNEREAWVQRMLMVVDANLAELDELGEA